MCFFVLDSCDKINCAPGKHCLVDQNMNPHCVRCIRKCPSNPSRRQVCGSDGITYPSACHLKGMACRRGKAIPIAYKGKCKCKSMLADVSFDAFKAIPFLLQYLRRVIISVVKMTNYVWTILKLDCRVALPAIENVQN